MKITIYRYPHPFEEGKWLYTGQTTDLKSRDVRHRKATEGFGKRFLKAFPGILLSQPDFYEFEVTNNLDANWEETVAIFRNHTWAGQGGMNLTLPGSTDYKSLASLGGLVQGPIRGRKNVSSGFLQSICSEGGKVAMSKLTPLERSQRGRLGASKAVKMLNHGIDGGKKSGRLAKDSGRLASYLTPENLSKGGRIAGALVAQKDKESGWMASLGKTGKGGRATASIPGHMSKAGKMSAHKQWHLNRGIKNPDCEFCKAA